MSIRVLIIKYILNNFLYNIDLSNLYLRKENIQYIHTKCLQEKERKIDIGSRCILKVRLYHDITYILLYE